MNPTPLLTPKQETFNLYKAFVKAKQFIDYMECVLASKTITHVARHRLGLTKKRGEGILSDFKLVLGDEALNEFNNELNSDVFVYDAIFEKLSQLKEGQRWEIEKQIDKIIEKNTKQCETK